MADTAHGTKFQNEFRARWLAMDPKRAYCWRFTDSADLYGMNSRLVNSGTQPADFVLVYNGWMGLADTKATIDPKGFKVSLVKPSQHIAATRSVAAGTPYVFPVKSMKTGEVYIVPARVVLEAKGTLLWSDLKSFLWPVGMTCPLEA